MHVKAKGRRVFSTYFILQSLKNPSDLGTGSRWGFIITKKVGSAVIRNFIRRRLKEVICHSLDQTAENTDYVIVAKKGIEKISFAALIKEFNVALRAIHAKT